MGSLQLLMLMMLTAMAQPSYGEGLGSLDPTEEQEDPSAYFKRFNIFDIELLQAYRNDILDGNNYVMSPLSIKAILGMILEGAGGRSATEIKDALRLSNNVTTKMIFKQINEELAQKDKANLTSASQIFVAQDLNVLEQYKKTITEHYYSGIEKVDFHDTTRATTKINNWVSEKTHGLINQIVSSDNIKSQTKLVLANALYFKDSWRYPFDVKNTKPGNFYSPQARSDKIQVDYMEMQAGLPYAHIPDLEAKAVELPYEDPRFSMIILLPDTKNGLGLLLRDFSHFSLDRVVSKMVGQEILLTLPRFSIECGDDIVQKLKSLRINDIFEQNANLSGILGKESEDVFISTLIHKVKIQVTEEGTEAAAATGGVVIPLMGSTIKVFKADHPFIFFIRSTTTGHILFSGVVNNPAKKMRRHSTSAAAERGENRMYSSRRS